MKRHSTSYVIREMQTKTMRPHYTPIRQKSRTLTPPKVSKGVELSCIADGNAK